MSDLDKEAEELYEKLLSSKEDISIAEFYEKHASKEFLRNARMLEERRQELRKKGIIEG